MERGPRAAGTRNEAGREREAHLWMLEGMDRVHRALQGARASEQMLADALDAALAIFACDRAWLLLPCDPEAPSWRVPMERTRPEYPGAQSLGVDVPMTEDAAALFRLALAANGPVRFDAESEHSVPETAKRFGVRAQMVMAIRPGVGQVYLFGLHQCSRERAWTPEEARLFQEIGRRIGDALTTVLVHRTLRDSELRYREIFENTSEAIVIYEVTEDGRFRFLDMNSAWIRMIGVERTLVGRCLDEFGDRPIVQAALGHYRRCLGAGTPIDFDDEQTTRAGHFHRHTTLIPVSNAAGRIYRLVSIARDVSEQKRAERELRSSEARLADAERIAHVGYWDRDLALDRISWSDETCRIFGVASEERGVRVEAFLEQVHPEDRHVVTEAMLDALRGTRRYDVEYRIVRPDGEIRHVHSQGDVLRDDDDAERPRRMFGTVQDITERKRTERALVESHGLLRAVIEGTSDLVFSRDLDGRYRMINSAGARLVGRTPEEVVGRSDEALLPPDVARLMRENDLAVVASGASQVFEETLEIDGVARTYLVSKGAHRDARGEVCGVVGIARDVTALKALAEEFRQAQKMEAVGRLAGGIAHDFNNLLTVINSYSEMVRDDLPPEHPGRKLLAAVLQAGERAAELTGQLLAFSRKQLLQPQVVDVKRALEALETLLRPMLGEAIEMVIACEPDLGAARIDPGHFEQAIVNLAVNARDAMPDGGRLMLEARNAELGAEHRADLQPGRYVSITVSDTGEGMDEPTIARIFEPFFTTKDAGKGTGLGLAMVYGFAKQSGGHVSVACKPGDGTTFELLLPRAEAAALTTAARASSLPQIVRGTETVLLVEDEDAVRRLARRVLGACGYRVLEARDGAEALDVASRFDGVIDALVTDLVMPHMNGRGLADRLVRARPGLRVLFVSGYTDEEVLRHGVARNQIHFLAKPFSPAELSRAVRAVLDESRAGAPAP